MTTPSRPDGGLTLPAGKTTHLFLTATTSSTRSTSRSSCSSGMSSRATINEFDLSIPPSDAGQMYPWPVRRAVRHRPRHHAVRGPCDDPGRVRDVVRQKRRRDQGVEPAAASGEPPAPAPRRRRRHDPTSSPRTSKFDQSTLTAPATSRSRSSSTTRTPARPTTSTSSTPAATKVDDNQDFPGVATQGLPGAAAPRGHLQVRVLDPPDADVRHAHGPVRSTDGDHHAARAPPPPTGAGCTSG